MTAALQPKQAPAIQVHALRKSYNGRKVLQGIELEVSQGETLSVLGQSGTGKSVLLKLLVGLQQPDSGSICIHGQMLEKLSREELNRLRKRMGFLFQNAAPL
jgi:phospholipid/cholesterol/gamma-HCH transport system ATP-binding protein